jgi:hypothetical protein
MPDAELTALLSSVWPAHAVPYRAGRQRELQLPDLERGRSLDLPPDLAGAHILSPALHAHRAHDMLMHAHAIVVAEPLLQAPECRQEFVPPLPDPLAESLRLAAQLVAPLRVELLECFCRPHGRQRDVAHSHDSLGHPSPRNTTSQRVNCGIGSVSIGHGGASQPGAPWSVPCCCRHGLPPRGWNKRHKGR